MRNQFAKLVLSFVVALMGFSHMAQACQVGHVMAEAKQVDSCCAEPVKKELECCHTKKAEHKPAKNCGCLDSSTPDTPTAIVQAPPTFFVPVFCDLEVVETDEPPIFLTTRVIVQPERGPPGPPGFESHSLRAPPQV